MYMYTNIKTLGVMCVRLSALGGVPRGPLSGHWSTKAPPGAGSSGPGAGRGPWWDVVRGETVTPCLYYLGLPNLRWL